MTCRGIRNKANITWFISSLRRLGGPCWGRGYCAIFYGNNQVKKSCFFDARRPLSLKLQRDKRAKFPSVFATPGALHARCNRAILDPVAAGS